MSLFEIINENNKLIRINYILDNKINVYKSHTVSQNYIEQNAALLGVDKYEKLFLTYQMDLFYDKGE